MVDSSQHDFCHFWVPLLDHVNAIGPTGPMGCHCGPCTATEPQPTSRQRQIGQHPGQLWCPFNAQKGLQTPPHIEVVALGEILNFVWSHHNQKLERVAPHQKQQPRRLIRGKGSLVQLTSVPTDSERTPLTQGELPKREFPAAAGGGCGLPSTPLRLVSPIWRAW